MYTRQNTPVKTRLSEYTCPNTPVRPCPNPSEYARALETPSCYAFGGCHGPTDHYRQDQLAPLEPSFAT